MTKNQVKGSKDIVIHVGLPKTGTTFLQNNVFPYIKNVNIIRNGFSSWFIADKINIISDERLSGCVFCEWWEDNVGDHFEIVDNLKNFFPDARIIVSTRDIDSWLKSFYSTYIRMGGRDKYDKWVSHYNISEKDFVGYVRYIKKKFVNVFHYCFEDFQRDTSGVVGDICGFIGCDVPVYDASPVNVGWGDRQCSMGRYINILFQDMVFGSGGVIPKMGCFGSHGMMAVYCKILGE